MNDRGEIKGQSVEGTGADAISIENVAHAELNHPPMLRIPCHKRHFGRNSLAHLS